MDGGWQTIGLAGQRSIPCLILVHVISRVGPDTICIGRAPRFGFPTLKRLLSKYRGGKVMTCPTDFGRP
eukprot:4815422-Lingulodinium_polyedra.AAC.1